MKKAIIYSLIIIFVLYPSSTINASSDREEPEIDFFQVFNEHGSIMLIMDAETGKLEFANQAAVDFYGYSLDQLLEKTIHEINALNFDEVDKEREAAANEERNYFVFPHRLASGELRTVEVHSYPFLLGDKVSLYSIIIDITAQTELEQSLKRNRTVIFSITVFSIILLISIVLILFKNKEDYKRFANKDALTNVYSRLFFR